jgi:hypothetical protein
MNETVKGSTQVQTAIVTALVQSLKYQADDNLTPGSSVILRPTQGTIDRLVQFFEQDMSLVVEPSGNVVPARVKQPQPQSIP